jgi:hypothetical protein
VQQVVIAGGRLRDALYDQLLTPNLPDPAFDAIDARHLRIIQVLSDFTTSPNSGDSSPAYVPVVRALNGAADDVGAVDPFDRPALAAVLAQSDASTQSVRGITAQTSGGVGGGSP